LRGTQALWPAGLKQERDPRTAAVAVKQGDAVAAVLFDMDGVLCNSEVLSRK
jgi:hypothetical protein